MHKKYYNVVYYAFNCYYNPLYMCVYYFVTLTGCRQVLLMVYCVKVCFVFHVFNSVWIEMKCLSAVFLLINQNFGRWTEIYSAFELKQEGKTVWSICRFSCYRYFFLIMYIAITINPKETIRPISNTF